MHTQKRPVCRHRRLRFVTYLRREGKKSFPSTLVEGPFLSWLGPLLWKIGTREEMSRSPLRNEYISDTHGRTSRMSKLQDLARTCTYLPSSAKTLFEEWYGEGELGKNDQENYCKQEWVLLCSFKICFADIRDFSKKCLSGFRISFSSWDREGDTLTNGNFLYKCKFPLQKQTSTLCSEHLLCLLLLKTILMQKKAYLR